MGGGRIPSSLLHDTIITHFLAHNGATYKKFEINLLIFLYIVFLSIPILSATL